MKLVKRRLSILTVDQVAWLFSTTTENILQRVEAGTLTAYHRNGDSIVFRRADVVPLLIRLGA